MRKDSSLDVTQVSALSDPIRPDVSQQGQEPLDLEPMKARVEGAFTGPWQRVYGGGGLYDVMAKSGGATVVSQLHICDAAFIAHARQDVPALIAEVERLRALASASASPHLNVDDMLDIYVPGNWRCPKCNYVLSSQTLFVGGPDAGSIGSTREQVMALSGEVCPNDGTPMARVTWRERANENQKWGIDLMEQVIAAVKAESLPDALKRIEERFAEAPEIRCQHCGEDIRYIDGQWLDRETHNTCDQPEGRLDRHHAPLESWVEQFRAFALPASASPGSGEGWLFSLKRAALMLTKSLPDELVEALRAEWGNTNLAVLKHWRDELTAELSALPASASPSSRLMDLAYDAARTNHIDQVLVGKGGHVAPMKDCPHPDCVLVRASASPGSGEGWLPIETAPERRKVAVTWVNALGKRRTTYASFWPIGTLDMGDEVQEDHVDNNGKNVFAGWYEESEANDEDFWRLAELLTHWQPLPDPPSALPASEGQEPTASYWNRKENMPTPPLSTHGLERTSPKGGPFIGRCIYCGTENLPMSAARERCDKAPSQEQQILDALDGPLASSALVERTPEKGNL